MRVKFYNYAWPNLCAMDVGFFIILCQKYGAKIVDDNADIIFYENRAITNEVSALKVFVTGENSSPAQPNTFDLVLGVRGSTPNFYFLPLWTFWVDWNNSISNYNIYKLMAPRCQSDSVNRSHFCGFVSCRDRLRRNSFVQQLSQRRTVTCAGRVLNNYPQVGPSKEDKNAFLKTCKFAIAFENDDYDDLQGYVTEKIIDAFAAGAIPIYWGDPTISSVFNAKAFLNRRDYESDSQFIDAIIELDNDEIRYNKMKQEPALLHVPEAFYPQAVCDKILSLLQEKKSRRVRFHYGANSVQVDVTDIASRMFIFGDKITIAASVSFNNLFGDVLPNVEKHLTVFIDCATTTLPEIRNSDFVMYVPSDASKNE